MKSKPPDTLQCKAGPVDVKQLSMVARDQEKIEHVLDRCWGFITIWCKPSPRYKQPFRNGSSSAEELTLQRDCFRNGSRAHKTISQWLRNPETFVMLQFLLERDPFKIEAWLVASYLEKYNDAPKTGARTAFAALKRIDNCCGTPKWIENQMVLGQIKQKWLE